MGFVEFGDQMPKLVPLAWTQVWFVVATGFFVVPVRFLMRKRMMNWMNPMRRGLESRGRVSLLLVLREPVVGFGNQMPNLVPLGWSGVSRGIHWWWFINLHVGGRYFFNSRGYCSEIHVFGSNHVFVV